MDQNRAARQPSDFLMQICANSANDLESVAADCLRADLGSVTSLTILDARSCPKCILSYHISCARVAASEALSSFVMLQGQ